MIPFSFLSTSLLELKIVLMAFSVIIGLAAMAMTHGNLFFAGSERLINRDGVW